MFNFIKKIFNRNKPRPEFVDTFAEATGGGWHDVPDVLPADGGSHKDYVGEQLELARQEAQDLPIGTTFSFRLTNIPTGINSPHEITIGMMMRAHDYGLQPGPMINERIDLTRIA